MALINSDVIPASATTYELEQSLRFNDDDSAYLSWTPSSAGNQKTWTWSGWIKRGNIGLQNHFFSAGTGSSPTFLNFGFNASDELQVLSWDYNFFETSQLFRDTSSWYHIVIVLDTSNSTASDRMRVYVNGNRVTDFSQDQVSNISQNQEFAINSTTQHEIGRASYYSSKYQEGYLAEVNFIDGQALDPTYFGETGTYGEWKPKAYSGTYGTNGYYLNFSGTYYNDQSGNGNNWTSNNLSTTDVVLDSPTNNFATLNPLWNPYEGSYSQGNLYWQPNANHSPSASTIPMESGKYYAEFRAISGSKLSFGVFSNLIKYRKVSGTNYIPGEHTTQDYTGDACVWYYNRIEHNASIQSYPFSSHILVSPNVYMIAFDSDSGKVWFGKEGVWYNNNNQSSTLDVNNPDVTMSVKQSDSFSFHATGENSDWKVNFGQDSSFSGSETSQGNTDGNGYGDFTYTPPSGFLALCTANLPDPAVIPSENFNTVIWTGNDTYAGRSITGVGFQPDFVWAKARSQGYSPIIYDVLRGTGSTAELATDQNIAEGGSSTSERGYLNSFDSDGFSSVVGSSSDNLYFNQSSQTYVAWNWKANGSGVSNTNGSITSTVSANQDAGFSIVSYSGNGTAGATVGHGLSQAPEMYIVKKRSASDHWQVYHHNSHPTTPEDYYLYLSSTLAATDYDMWNDTAPTNQVFSLSSYGGGNQSSATYIAYCFHSVDGFSKVGSYTGNGSTDGTFVYTGFAVKFVMIKATGLSTQSWRIHDNERNPENVNYKLLYANLSNAEGGSSTYGIDLVSNGFKIRTSDQGWNSSGQNYIYIAFAEVPFSVGGGIAR